MEMLTQVTALISARQKMADQLSRLEAMRGADQAGKSKCDRVTFESGYAATATMYDSEFNMMIVETTIVYLKEKIEAADKLLAEAEERLQGL